MKITRKQKKFADELIKNPKISATEAANRAYNVATRRTAEVIASENLRKPEIMLYLENHADKALLHLLEIDGYSREYGKSGTREGSNYASVATSINRDILDRTLGKPKQSIEQHTTTVNLNLDLTKITDSGNSD